MRQRVDVRNALGASVYVEFIDPDYCPMCGKAIEPVYKYAFVDNNDELSVFYYCTGCKHSFISRFDNPQIDNNNRAYKIYQHRESIPKLYFENSFSKEISDLSSRFVSIYNQASQAESLKLNEICGMGYRKALEYLIFDYVLTNKLASEDDLKQTTLSNCIKKYLDNDYLKQIAEGANWLGNDQTHYFVKHEDYDIEDLKEYILSAVSLLEGQIRAKKLENNLLNRKR